MPQTLWLVAPNADHVLHHHTRSNQQRTDQQLKATPVHEQFIITQIQRGGHRLVIRCGISMAMSLNRSLVSSASILVLCVAASLTPARGDEGKTSPGIDYFETNIRPLLARHCYQCHSRRTNREEGGLLLDTRSGWMTGGERGSAIVPGDPDASLLLQAVRYADSALQMPPDGPLPDQAIQHLHRWIQLGAPDPRDESPNDVADDQARHQDSGRAHWSYQPLQRHDPPQVSRADWPLTSIDSFILSALESAQLKPADDASRRDLLRRLHFQLTGLPPTPQQMNAFVNDQRPDVVHRIVDQLLGSFHFGQRWGRHWLDLARYADSNGLDENFLFREAWRYRNWVIDAVNADVPFDRFIEEQIAGDLLPFESIQQRDRQRIAAGFLVVGPKVLLGNDERRQRMEVADEQLDTIGRAILGQTFGCARCHDHKFDPVPTADYYAMAGILTSTQVMQRRHMLNQQRVMERLVGLGADGDTRNSAYEAFWRDRPGLLATSKRAKSALQLLKKGNTKGLQALARQHSDAVAPDATDANRSAKQRLDAQNALIAKLDARLDSPPTIPPRAMIPADTEQPSDDHIRLGGQFDRLGDPVPRGFLRVLSKEANPVIPEGSSGRRELARWLTDVDHGAGVLAARVLANRIWHHLLGRGMVRTVDNFGRQGEPPSHPELLDYLAADLIEGEWSLKTTVRKVVLSRTFARGTDHQEANYERDPENRLLWKAHRRRLDPESLRDAILLAAGQLDQRLMKSTVWYLKDQATAVGANKVRRRTDFPCRSVYLPVIRNDLPELFEVFDFADPHFTTGARPQTTVALQGLFMMNDEQVMAAADATAKRLLAECKSGDELILLDRMFELILNVRPTDDERIEFLSFIHETHDALLAAGTEQAQWRAWSMACHAMFALSRFQFLE